MLVDPPALLAVLRLPPGTTLDLEPAALYANAPEHVTLCPPGGERLEVLVRRAADGEAAANNAAVHEALSAAGFAHMPRLLGVVGDATVEEWVEGWTALNLEIPFAVVATGVEVLAELHALPVREGLRREAGTDGLLPAEEFPLHRLGFAQHEREPARAPLADARAALIAGPFGFVHGNATAQLVLFAPGRTLVRVFAAAGFGHQLFDVAAYLATAGLTGDERRDMARRYARLRGLDLFATIDLADLATLWWGLHEQLGLPRRMLEALGDDAATEQLKVAAGRIERAVREPAGASPVAAAIRAALWPGVESDR